MSGQISLGKGYASRTVIVESTGLGVWLIKTAQTIPDSELWMYEPGAAARLDQALAALGQGPSDSHLEPLDRQLSVRP